MKDEDNSLSPERQPGPLADLLGARVEQWYALDTTVPLEGTWGNGQDKIWAEQIGVKSPETQVLMRYGKSNGWLDGQPAAVTRKVGKGSITYIGACTRRDNHEGCRTVDDDRSRSPGDHARSAKRRRRIDPIRGGQTRAHSDKLRSCAANDYSSPGNG